MKMPGIAAKPYSSSFPAIPGICVLNKENGSKEARTPDLSRVRRTLIPAELCFHGFYYSTLTEKSKQKFVENNSF